VTLGVPGAGFEPTTSMPAASDPFIQQVQSFTHLLLLGLRMGETEATVGLSIYPRREVFESMLTYGFASITGDRYFLPFLYLFLLMSTVVTVNNNFDSIVRYPEWFSVLCCQSSIH